MNIQDVIEELKKKKFDKALSGIDEILNKNPNTEQNINLKGVILLNLERVIEARKCWFQAIRINKQYFDPFYNLGDSYLKKNEHDDALKYFTKALDLQPKNFIVHFRIGYLFMQKQNWDKALLYFNKSMDLNNQFPNTFFNMAIILNLLNKKKESIQFFKSYIELQPNNIEAYYSLGICYREIGDIQMAEKTFLKAFKINPEYPYLKGQLQFMKNHLCDWVNYNETKKNIEKDIEQNKKAITPWQALSVIESPKLLKDNTALFLDNKEFNNKNLIDKKKITLGYFSPDFCEHAVSNQFKQILKLHDKKKFEIVGFYLNSKQDEKLYEIKTYFDKFLDVRLKTDEQIVEMSRELKIDIAVDLKGFTLNNRFGIFVKRCAPLQISYLGYPGTLASDSIDYLVADKILIPDENKKFYSEKIIYMPNTYQVNDSTLKVSEKKFERKDLGLPEKGIVFCSFNQSYKILPDMFKIWTQIIKKVENSVLWLMTDNEITEKNLKNEFIKNDIKENRLIFASRMHHREHLSRLKLADIFLDTFPYNAHTTASDALRVGIPVVTLKGQSFASRVASSLLNCLDLNELTTDNENEYQKVAIKLAENNSLLQEIKRKINSNISTKPLFDTKLFTQHLEKAYLTVIQRLKKNKSLDHIEIN